MQLPVLLDPSCGPLVSHEWSPPPRHAWSGTRAPRVTLARMRAREDLGAGSHHWCPRPLGLGRRVQWLEIDPRSGRGAGLAPAEVLRRVQ